MAKMGGCNENHNAPYKVASKGGVNTLMRGAYEKTTGRTMAGTKSIGSAKSGRGKTGSSGPRGSNPVR